MISCRFAGETLKIMNENFINRIGEELEAIKTAGLYKTERIITSEQGAEIEVGGKKVLNFCANNYLGLSSHQKHKKETKNYKDERS